jgi:hypothetical protein
MNSEVLERPVFADELTQQMADFLIDIGLEVRSSTLEDDTFVPGILIEDGVLLVDEARLKYPGDLLHEAGHLAVVEPDKRRQMGAYAGMKIHEELAAIAWSWAALKLLDLPPEVVFHPDGYKGESQAMIDAFSDTRGPGIPILAWIGMCSDPHAGEAAIGNDLPAFPKMSIWLRECETPA